jgi:hypothetical protein
LFDAQWASEEAFFERFAQAFWAKSSSNVGFGEKLLVPFSSRIDKTGTLE